jgi:hypothetical protein
MWRGVNQIPIYGVVESRYAREAETLDASYRRLVSSIWSMAAGRRLDSLILRNNRGTIKSSLRILKPQIWGEAKIVTTNGGGTIEERLNPRGNSNPGIWADTKGGHRPPLLDEIFPGSVVKVQGYKRQRYPSNILYLRLIIEYLF